MLAYDMNEEFGLAGQYLVDFCATYGEDYALLESMKDTNPLKGELMYLYRSGALARFVWSLVPVEEVENILFSMEDDFTKAWNHAGGGDINLEDVAALQLQQKWELIYILLAVYYGKAEDEIIFITPTRDKLNSLVDGIRVFNLQPQDNYSIH